jgi:hypothetical protein
MRAVDWVTNDSSAPFEKAAAGYGPRRDDDPHSVPNLLGRQLPHLHHARYTSGG